MWQTGVWSGFWCTLARTRKFDSAVRSIYHRLFSYSEDMASCPPGLSRAEQGTRRFSPASLLPTELCFSTAIDSHEAGSCPTPHTRACGEYTPLFHIVVPSPVALELGCSRSGARGDIYLGASPMQPFQVWNTPGLGCIEMLTGVHPALFSLAATRAIVQSIPPHPEAPRNAKPPGLGCSPRLLDVASALKWNSWQSVVN